MLKPFMHVEPTVFVVDPDEIICAAIRKLASLMNLRCEVFGSGDDFLETLDPSRSGCLITELVLPGGLNGLQLQQCVAAMQATLPIVFLTAQATLPIAVRAMRNGAYHFLEKPFYEQELWDTIEGAIALDGQRRRASMEQAEVQTRLSCLNSKEHEVLKRLASGLPNRTIAKELDLSIRTIEIRRGAMMKKLGLKTPEELLGFAMTVYKGRDGAPGNGHANHRPSAPLHALDRVPRATPVPSTWQGWR